ncbi:fluoride efflux transporter CrcB [Aurantimonas sp. A2-1-M11]|uniref:fluoride efflux transporter CrcB n=1 Tax=Aurantimonas sp. A2-1-M11 TaxID=3113712 RepID=UPI002F927D15
MSHLLIVAAGGAVGATLRHLSGMAALRLFGAGFPWGTVVVNVLGSFLMGLFIELAGRRFDAPQEIRLLVATGCLGGFTTFSTFSLDAVVLAERGSHMLAAIYVIGSVVAAIGALFAGLALARWLA